MNAKQQETPECSPGEVTYLAYDSGGHPYR